MIYIGATSDLKKRITEHKTESGSSYTRKYHLKFLIYFEEFTEIHQAISREKQLKNWHKDWKWNLARSVNPDLKDLYEEL